MAVLGSSDVGRVWVSTYRGRPPGQAELEKVQAFNMTDPEGPRSLPYTDSEVQVDGRPITARAAFVPASAHYNTDRWAVVVNPPPPQEDGRRARAGSALPELVRWQHDVQVTASRAVRLLALAVWLAGGGLWVLLTLMLMLADPAGDVDREFHTVLFLVSMAVWCLVAIPLLKLARRRNRT